MTALATTDWLPDRLIAANYDDINALEIASYALFKNDWSDFAAFRGDEVRVHRRPHKANAARWHTYWHAVTEGFPEEIRKNPMTARLERIPWCRPIIVNENDAVVKVWSNFRKGSKHICIWFDRLNYIVILKQCQNHYLLKTTYCPESRRQKQFHREYAAWKKTGRAL